MGRLRRRAGQIRRAAILAWAAAACASVAAPAMAQQDTPAPGVEVPPGSVGGPDEPGGVLGGQDEAPQTLGGSANGAGPSGGRRREQRGEAGRIRLGDPLGASGTADFGRAPGMLAPPLGGRPGVLGSRIPAEGLLPPSGTIRRAGEAGMLRPLEMEPEEVERLERLQRLERPATPADPGPPDGLTLDAAIARLVEANLDLLALRYEIPKAEADVLTAGLRNNPILFADGQLIPYGWYTEERPGGQIQYDLNVTVPVDVTGKRRARVAVARQAKRVLEAQFQDAVRGRIEDLHTAFVNVVAARETLRYAEAYRDGIARILEEAKATKARAEDPGPQEVKDLDRAINTLRDQERQARYQIRETERNLARSRREMALLLDLDPAQAERIRVRDPFRDVRDLPLPPEELVGLALRCRPDLQAYRLAVGRADADVRLARANRYGDVYVLYQPYTFQDNRTEGPGLRNAHSWALGVTAALPVFNRNQGNVARAAVNAQQIRVELADAERVVAHDAREAIEEFRETRAFVLELEREVLPSSRRARDDAYRKFREDPAEANDYVDKQLDYNEVVRQYRTALVRHRRSMLRVNTALAVRLLP